eukprot:scaffold22582_cov194-Cylindrotheca_fusiformis.AAC.7
MVVSAPATPFRGTVVIASECWKMRVLSTRNANAKRISSVNSANESRVATGQPAPDGEDYVCGCSTGFLDGIYAAGRHCDAVGSSMCDSGNKNLNEPCESGGYQCDCEDSNDGPRCEYSAEETTAWKNCGCDCLEGWEGMHCEIQSIAATPSDTDDDWSGETSCVSTSYSSIVLLAAALFTF